MSWERGSKRFLGCFLLVGDTISQNHTGFSGSAFFISEFKIIAWRFGRLFSFLFSVAAQIWLWNIQYTGTPNQRIWNNVSGAVIESRVHFEVSCIETSFVTHGDTWLTQKSSGRLCTRRFYCINTLGAERRQNYANSNIIRAIPHNSRIENCVLLLCSNLHGGRGFVFPKSTLTERGNNRNTTLFLFGFVYFSAFTSNVFSAENTVPQTRETLCGCLKH